MVTFTRMEWQQVPIEGHPGHHYSTMEETEQLEFESSDINDVMAKAQELQDAGWFEVIIRIEGFTITYDALWER